MTRFDTRTQPRRTLRRSNALTLRAFALAVLGACASTSAAGPFSGEYGGLSPTSTVFRGWIAGYTEYVQPDALSGGYARSETGGVSDVGQAIVGRPVDFSLGSATRHVLSLGNGGSITLVFDGPIRDGPGPDFSVFENGFTDGSDWTGTSREGATNTFTFAELAFVDVASETSAWVRFPVTCLNTTLIYAFNNLAENRFASQDVTLLDGVASKHRIEYGTPFDLARLTNEPAVLGGQADLNDIRYIRLTDVVGDGSRTDALGRAIYDPYYSHTSATLTGAAPASTDGFDLRAVGVINFADVSIRRNGQGVEVSWYAATNSTYQAQGGSLSGSDWVGLGPPVVGDRQTHAVVDTNAGSAVRFYRVMRTMTGGD